MIRQNAFFGYVPGGQRKREHLQSTPVKGDGKGSGKRLPWQVVTVAVDGTLR